MTPKGNGRQRKDERSTSQVEGVQKDAVRRRDELGSRITNEATMLQMNGFSEAETKRALDPVRSLHDQLKEEVHSFEKLMRGEFDELCNFQGLGRLLIALRIAKGVSQRELSERLGVHESQVSRDERNEYHGVTVERAGRILECLGVEVKSVVEGRV